MTPRMPRSSVVGALPRARALLGVLAAVASVVLLLSFLSVTTSRAAFSGATDNAGSNVSVFHDDYSREVLRGSPTRYWRLDEPSGSTALFDSTGYRGALTAPSTLTSVAGVLPGNNATHFTNDCTGEPAYARDISQLTLEAWFKTASGYTGGGTIIQFNGNLNTATSTSTFHDRELFLDGAGRVVLGTWPIEMTTSWHPNGSDKVVTSPAGYNDGSWHHAVGSIGPGGAVLYVDGAQVAADATITYNDSWTNDDQWGQWHVGCGVYAASSSYPGSASYPPQNNITATLDEVAIYDRILTPAEVATHYEARSRSGTNPIYPTTVRADSPWNYQRFSGTPGRQYVTNKQFDLVGNDAPNTLATATFDLSGNGHGANVSPGVYSVGGAIAGDSSAGQGFNGTTGCLYLPASLTNPTTFSLELWFRTTAGHATGGVLAQLNSAGDATTTTPTNYDRSLYLTNGGKLVFATRSSSATSPTTASYNDGRWHHVVATLSGGTAANLYVDGTLAASATLTAPASYTGYWHVACGRTSGYPSAPTTTYFTKTAIDELATYTTALSASAVATHYGAGIGGRQRFTTLAPRYSPWSWLRLDEASGAVLDSSGNARSWVASAGGITRSTAGVFAGGPLSPANNAYTFNGSSGCLVNTTSYGSFPSTFAVSFWFKTSSSAGGPMVQLNNNASANAGSPSTYDPSIYLGTDGKVNFVVYNGSTNVVTSGSSYNDGAWHHVFAQLSGDGMDLFMDGAIAASKWFLYLTPTSTANAYEHVGCGRIRSGITNGPSSSYFNGVIDEYQRFAALPGRGYAADIWSSTSW